MGANASRCILTQLTLPAPPTADSRNSQPYTRAVVIMGVAGCGKSTLGQAIALRMNWPMIEGDDFHSPENKALMQAGVPLGDAERSGWLKSLAKELQTRDQGTVLTCSALKAAYREILRAASPGLAFVFLDIPHADALGRVGSRNDHFMPPELVKSQFQALEDPGSEPRVLRLDARLPLQDLTDQAVRWLMGYCPEGA